MRHVVTEFQPFWKADRADGSSVYYDSSLSRSAVLQKDAQIVNVVKVRGYGLYDTDNGAELLGVFASPEEASNAVAQTAKVVNEAVAEAAPTETPNEEDNSAGTDDADTDTSADDAEPERRDEPAKAPEQRPSGRLGGKTGRFSR
jgi:hypothetical protein